MNEFRQAELGLSRALRAAKAITTNDSDTVRGLETAELLVAECRIFAQALADDSDLPQAASRLLSCVVGWPVKVTGTKSDYAALVAYCDRNRSKG